MPLLREERSGAPIVWGGHTYVPVSRTTRVGLSRRGHVVFISRDRPLRVDVDRGASPATPIIDWDLRLRVGVAAIVLLAVFVSRRFR